MGDEIGRANPHNVELSLKQVAFQIPEIAEQQGIHSIDEGRKAVKQQKLVHFPPLYAGNPSEDDLKERQIGNLADHVRHYANHKIRSVL